MKRNFVIFLGGGTDCTYFYSDLYEVKYVKLVEKKRFYKSKIKSAFFRLFFSQKFNRRVKIPFKRIFFNSIANQVKFENNNETVYVFIQGWYDKNFASWLKKKHPEIKTILFFDDTVEVSMSSIPTMDPYNLNKEFDFVLSYNPGDVNKYNFQYSNAYFSKTPIDYIDKEMKCDVSFVGLAKDRLDLIHDVYDKLVKELDCNFIVGGVDKKSNTRPGIQYINQNIPYMEYLKIENASDCIIDIVKGDTEGCTHRVWEAVYYNKKLITNWKGIRKFSFYNPNYMLYFEKVDDIDCSFVQNDITVSYHYNNENSPVHLLEHINELLGK